MRGVKAKLAEMRAWINQFGDALARSEAPFVVLILDGLLATADADLILLVVHF